MTVTLTRNVSKLRVSARQVDTEWAKIVAELTRRALFTGSAGAATTVWLGACQTSQSGEPEQSAGGFTADGIPLQPKRVVVLDERTALDFALSAGYPIVATVDRFQSFLPKRLPADVQRLTQLEGFGWEEIMTLQPDLFVIDAVRDSSTQQQLDRTGVPVLEVANSFKVFVDSTWQEVAVRELDAIGRGDQARTQQRDYRAAVEAGRKRIGSLATNKVVAIGGADKDANLWYLTEDSLTNAVAADLRLGLLSDKSQPDPEKGFWRYSGEDLDIFTSADLLIMQSYDTDKAYMDGNPLFAGLPAVRAGRVFALPRWARTGYFQTAIATVDLVCDAVELLA